MKRRISEEILVIRFLISFPWFLSFSFCVWCRMGVEEIRKVIDADSLAFLPLEKLRGMLQDEAPTFCDACFSGDYPVPPRDLVKDKEELQKPVMALVEGYEGKFESAAIFKKSWTPPDLEPAGVTH